LLELILTGADGTDVHQETGRILAVTLPFMQALGAVVMLQGHGIVGLAFVDDAQAVVATGHQARIAHRFGQGQPLAPGRQCLGKAVGEHQAATELALRPRTYGIRGRRFGPVAEAVQRLPSADRRHCKQDCRPSGQHMPKRTPHLQKLLQSGVVYTQTNFGKLLTNCQYPPNF